METGTIHHKLENISSLSSTKLVQVQVLEAFFFIFYYRQKMKFLLKNGERGRKSNKKMDSTSQGHRPNHPRVYQGSQQIRHYSLTQHPN